MHIIAHDRKTYKKASTSNEVENSTEEQILQDYLNFCSWVDFIYDDLILFKKKQCNASGINKRNAGRKGYDPCMMFKICLFHIEFGLSGKKMFIRLYDNC